MGREIERGFYVGPKLTLSKISEFLEKENVKEYMQNHPEIKLPNLKKPKGYLTETIDDYINSDKLNLRELSSDTNEVSILIDTFGLLPRILVLKWNNENNKEALIEEKNITEYLYELLRSMYKEKRFSVPEPIMVKPLDSRWFYGMRRIHGETLKEKIDRNALDLGVDLERVVDFLALIHVNIDLEKFDLPKTLSLNKSKENIKKRLENVAELGFDRKSTRIIEENLEPIIEIWKNYDTVFYKDAQPKNWIIPPNKNINAVDFEIRGQGITIPEYDLVCLMELIPSPKIDTEKKDELIGKYGEYFADYSKKSFRNLNESKKIYLNSSLYRAVSVAGTFSESKEEWKRNILTYLENSVNNIGRIKVEYHSDYLKFSLNYEKLADGLKWLEDFLVNQVESKNASSTKFTIR